MFSFLNPLLAIIGQRSATPGDSGISSKQGDKWVMGWTILSSRISFKGIFVILI